MSALVTLANTAWLLGNLPSAARFEKALATPADAQRQILNRYLRDNAGTQFGVKYGFAALRTVDEFQQRVPISTYEDHQPWIAKIAAGEQRVLTRAAVQRFVPTSGSTQAQKWIAYTQPLLKEFGRGIAPWISNLFQTYPAARHGPAYWSISPATPVAIPQAQVPVGFDEDSAYVGGWLKRLANATFAVPGEVRNVPEMDAFRYVTLLCLLRARELRLISVWHPSFFTLLLGALQPYWERLLDDIRAGTTCPPSPIPPAAAAALSRGMRGNATRAAELQRLGPHEPKLFWPRLAVISCWQHAHARAGAKGLAALFPFTPLQGKGLLSTEAFVSLPYILKGVTHYPLAVRSHFFEFLPQDGSSPACTAGDLDAGGIYTVAVTTGGGLYRYNTHDQVRVTGRLRETPTLEFLGKADLVSDRFGEKLNALFVADVLSELESIHALLTSFLMLAPEGNAYTLFMETAATFPPGLAASLDELLCRNPHYAYCRRLGQLKPAQIFHVRHGAGAAYLEHCRRKGKRLGEIKPTPLHTADDWVTAFEGGYRE